MKYSQLRVELRVKGRQAAKVHGFSVLLGDSRGTLMLLRGVCLCMCRGEELFCHLRAAPGSGCQGAPGYPGNPKEMLVTIMEKSTDNHPAAA